jgi:hypothetical protein
MIAGRPSGRRVTALRRLSLRMGIMPLSPGGTIILQLPAICLYLVQLIRADCSRSLSVHPTLLMGSNI